MLLTVLADLILILFGVSSALPPSRTASATGYPGGCAWIW